MKSKTFVIVICLALITGATTFVTLTQCFQKEVIAGEEYVGECSDCNGSGKCGVCNGAGKIICTSCIGPGKVPDLSTKRIDLSTNECPDCGGSGMKRCSDCNGTGDCYACKGTGIVLALLF